MAHRNAASAIPLSTTAFGDVNNATFTALNSGGLADACFIIRIINDTDGDLLLSYDGGTTTHDRIASINAFTTEPHTLAVPLTQNRNGEITEWKNGQVVYGMYDGTAATTGNIYISGYDNQET